MKIIKPITYHYNIPNDQSLNIMKNLVSKLLSIAVSVMSFVNLVTAGKKEKFELICGGMFLKPVISDRRTNLERMGKIYRELFDVEEGNEMLFVLYPYGIVDHVLARDIISREESQECFNISLAQSMEKNNVVYQLFPYLSKDDGWTSKKPAIRLSEFYFSQLDKAVNILKEAGVAHMDLRPDNIIWRKNENGDVEIKLIDFDLSSFFGSIIPYPDLLTSDRRYPLLEDDTRKFIPASHWHNIWFLESIRWWLWQRKLKDFGDFMKVNYKSFRELMRIHLLEGEFD